MFATVLYHDVLLFFVNKFGIYLSGDWIKFFRSLSMTLVYFSHKSIRLQNTFMEFYGVFCRASTSVLWKRELCDGSLKISSVFHRKFWPIVYVLERNEGEYIFIFG